ncbi:MAG: hypothetical protein AAFN92_05620 [Bacteroidota bacterium]
MITIPKRFPALLALFALLFLSWSCDEEQFVDNNEPFVEEITVAEEMPQALIAALPPDVEEDPNSSGDPEADAARDGRRGCFRFVYPISVELDNGTVLTASDNQELRSIYQRIRDAETGANFVYPFQVTLRNGVEFTVEGFAQFRRLQNFCLEGSGDDQNGPCFRFNFPIDLSIDGETVTVNDGAEWRRAVIAAGREATIRIVYPISVTVAGQDEPLVLEDREALIRLRRRCISVSDDPCLRYFFPLRLNVDGETTFVRDFREWRRVAQAADSVSIAYPLTVLFRGQRILIRTPEQLRRVLNACGEVDDDGEDERPCLRFVFPVTLDVNGEEVTVNSLREWHQAAREGAADGTGADVSIVYPVTVNFRGEEVTLNSTEQLQRLRNACG